MSNVGVNVIEVDGKASPTIQSAPTSVGALVGLTERGIPDVAVRVTSPQQFSERFGSYRADGFLAYAIDGFFLNGGQQAYVTRVVGAGSAAASEDLDNIEAVAAPTLRVRAGYRGQPDPGDWGERLRIDVRDDSRGRNTVALATGPAATSVQLASLDGFQVGSVARFVSAGVTSYRRITAITQAFSTITWVTPIAAGLLLGDVASTAEFRLIVRYQATPTSSFAVVEDWRRLSMEDDVTDYAINRINHPNTGSKYITTSDLSGATLSGLENPAVVSNVALLNGVENAATAPSYQGSAALKTGLHSFDTSAVQLVAVPDSHHLGAGPAASVVRGAIDYCAARGDCMFVGAAPDRTGGPTIPRARSQYTQLESDYMNTVRGYSAQFQGAKVYGALYTPFVLVNDPIGPGPTPVRFIPPDGHVMGVYARTEQERGIFKAPAGIQAQTRGVLDVAATFSDEQHTDLVRNALVNGIRPTPGAGIVVSASRTLSSDTRWWFVNVRLLFNFVKSSLRDGLRFVRQEPHSEELRRTVRLNVVTPFLLGLWRQGAFGSDAPAQVFTVKCDAENNPPSEVNLGNFRIEVYFYPVRPAETILVIVGQQPSGASAKEG